MRASDERGEMADGDGAALQVIVLGSGGGPFEDNTTAFLVRSTSTDWTPGSVLAVDAGVHLSAIKKMFSRGKITNSSTVVESGPFKGFDKPYSLDSSNAAYVTGTLVDTFLITHPHLDHISGFVIATSGLPPNMERPKRLAGLPGTIRAFKEHIFNGVIWPNLTDENDGVGLVTYLRLQDSNKMSEDGKGYMDICEGLSVNVCGVSHGRCSSSGYNDGGGTGSPMIETSPQHKLRSNRQQPARTSFSRSASNPEVTTPVPAIKTYSRSEKQVYDSAAYFIRDNLTATEVLIFGDVEPDTISLFPRNHLVWRHAATLIASSRLGAILIECSYDNSVSSDRLYGHMAPRFLLEELTALGKAVDMIKHSQNVKGRKRKRASSAGKGDMAMVVGREGPLSGVKLVIIHVKDMLEDGPAASAVILDELRGSDEGKRLGCDFLLAVAGEAVYM